MEIPTEPIGSVPRPRELVGEQLKPSFVTYPIHGLTSLAAAQLG